MLNNAIWITRIRKREQNTQQTGAPEEKIINMISTSVYKFDQLKKTFYQEPNKHMIITYRQQHTSYG